jgi:hypothetical protein
MTIEERAALIEASRPLTFGELAIEIRKLPGVEDCHISAYRSIPGVVIIYVFGDGGDDKAIAQTIFNNLQVSVTTIGSTVVPCEMYGFTHDIRFQRVPIPEPNWHVLQWS